VTLPPVQNTELDDQPDIKALIEQLVTDTSDFARAEIGVIKAQADERVSHALPATLLLGTGVALVFGTFIGALIGAMLWLGPIIGAGWAIVAVGVTALMIAALLIRLGTNRVRLMFRLKDRA
jgi:hypothetical protein